jgi:hypothetical protein
MATDLSNPLRKFKLVFLGEQSGELSVHVCLPSRFGIEHPRSSQVNMQWAKPR